jgi:hypothetical protein
MENNRFKYRPEIKSIEDLQPGDEFLVGDERWQWMGRGFGMDDGCNFQEHDRTFLVGNLIRANVPIERDIPYPEGGAEKWELREGDYTVFGAGTLLWNPETGEWETRPADAGTVQGWFYAIPKAKPQDKAKPAPKVYTVANVEPGNSYVSVGFDFQPGDKVTVERVMR